MNWPIAMRLWRVLLLAFTGVACLYLVFPTFVIVPLSFSSSLYLTFPPPGWSTQWYVNLWNSPTYSVAFLHSILIGLPAAALAMIFGTMLALALVRGKVWGTRGLTALAIAPFLLPQIILAIGLYSILAKFGLTASYLGVTLGHAVVATPLVFITVSAALRSYDSTFEMAAMTLGANGWKSFWFVTFPMIRLGVLAGGIFAFSFSFDEIIIALFLTNTQTTTLPKQLYSELRYNMTPTIAAASSVIITISLLLLAAVAVIEKRARRRIAAAGVEAKA
ncbi:MAG: putative spermidine/putrescine transport system permease protein [Rhodospirillaceae bacterium]|jgi:ABC-type spermidine/putrescine transport system permease subunit II|nr:putative spermidine/putrescine transport system permease protein [Rhodospirillaceae bacterium]